MMHPEARDFVRRYAGRPRRVVEFGARNFNGSVRDLFPSSAYTGVDLLPGEGVDVVADAADWRPPPHQDAPDLIVCCETLEHAPHPSLLVWNAGHILAPGGRLVLTAAAPGRAPHSGIDGGPPHPGEHYENVSPHLLLFWLAGWDIERFEYDGARGDLYAAARKV